MARVCTYLIFPGTAEKAFSFYRTVFGTDFASITRMGDMPSDTPFGERDRQLVAHAELPILGGHSLMASDMLESMGQVRPGNSVTIELEPDSRDETARLFGLLSDGGSDIAPLVDMPWGAYWGTFADRFGVRWMFNHYGGER